MQQKNKTEMKKIERGAWICQLDVLAGFLWPEYQA